MRDYYIFLRFVVSVMTLITRSNDSNIKAKAWNMCDLEQAR